MDKKGWGFHAHQIETAQHALNGDDVVLFAPTGAGKTLAGFLAPLIDLQSCDNDDYFLHTLYISPLKALSVDVHRNLERPIADLKLPIRLETRTGDTPSSKRTRQKNKPPHILMTTPESFALLLSYEEASDYFKNLKFIVIDELHALMHKKRGDLLSLGLSRLFKLAPNAVRIGLSATLPDQTLARDYLVRPQNIGKIVSVKNPVKPEVEVFEPSARIPWSGHMATHAIPELYSRLVDNKMSIVFVNTRAQSELIFQELWRVNDKNLRIALHHGSLEKELRRAVEKRMAEGALDCVVATSSLDLGLDWANVDLVVQIGAPKGVSRLMQRLGRSNHRLDEPSKALLVPTNRFEYLEALAAERAIERGELDGETPKQGGLDVLAQHIIGVACSTPFEPDDLFSDITSAWPYKDLPRSDFDRVLSFVRDGGYALKTYERYARLNDYGNGVLGLSDARFRRQYRMNIGTIVEAAMLKVKLGRRTLGKIEEYFILNLSPGDSFIFGGDILRYDGIKDMTVMVSKTKADTPKVPAYAGGNMPLNTHLSGHVRQLLFNQSEWGDLPKQVKHWLDHHKSFSVFPEPQSILIESFPRAGKNFIVIYSFEGRNANQTLGFLLSRRMARMGLKPLGFVFTDYALTLWSFEPVEKTVIAALMDTDLLGQELEEWLDDTPMIKRLFKKVAVISGLIERRLPGQEKTGKQVTFSSDLIYDVLKKHEPDHILLKAARQDSLSELVDLKRLSDFLHRIQNQIVFKRLDKVSPLSVPMILEVGREMLNKKDVEAYYLDDLEQSLLDEVGLELD